MPVTRAFTMIELVVAAAVSAVLATVLYQLLWQGRMIGERLGAQSAAGQEARLRVKKMTNEIQEGTRLFYPRPGATADGVGFVNARGETVMYFVDFAAAGAPELKRVNLNAPKEPAEVLVKRVKHMRCTTAIAGRGRAASRVNIDLAVGGDTERTTVNVATSVFLRSLEKHVPEDPTHEPVGVKREEP